ncbi:MAG TPA: lysylphosphatidylglycerol synthase transmembrane domain-containing protein [Elusimicrobiota bacterium]|nr:lysylphosphatidylglycerol synthase transmembrane domain-containing protein [Elusimicrobiota bacterium]
MLSFTRRHLSAAAALAVTLAFLALALRHVQVGKLWEIFSQARWRWVAIMCALSLADLSVRAWRWRLLLSDAAPEAPAKLLFRLEAVGIALNNILFLRLGEFARAYMAGRELDVPVLAALSSVGVERALDLAALLSLFCWVGSTSPDFSYPGFLRAGAVLLVLTVGGLVFLAAAGKPLKPGGSWHKKLSRWPKIQDLASQMALGASVLRRPAAATAAAAGSLGLWIIDSLFYWAGARALQLGSVLGFKRSVLVLTWSGAGTALPAAPGAFGTFEDFVKSLLMDFKVSAQKAFAYAFFNHMVAYIFVTLLGLAFLYQEGLSLAELKGALRHGRDA